VVRNVRRSGAVEWRPFVSYTENEGLAGNRVRSIYEDNDGTFWIGTYDGGLGRLKNGKFTRYRTEDGLYNNGAFEILEDDQKNFWISCNRGIYRVKKQELNDFAAGKIKSIASVSFGRQDGLLNIECNGGRQPSGLKTPDGKLWFPTQGGIAVIDPRSVPFNSKAPSVFIESGTLEREHLPLDGEIRIPPGKGNLEVTYTALSLIKSEQIRFKYKLQGLDNDWTDIGTRRTVYFSHLPPGQYTLEIIAANSDGVWSPQGAQIRIDVIPSFWQTWWFAVTVTLAVIAIALLSYKRRVSQLERANMAQAAFSRQLIESQEGERKRIAAELHDSLGQNLLIIKNWTLLALNKVNGDKDLKEQLNEISTTASQSIEEVRGIAHDLRPYQIDDIGLTRVLKAMINRVAASSEIQFTSDIDNIDNALPTESQIGFYRIVQEALNNIVKHSKATAANIRVKREHKNLVLSIEDNGEGFSRESTVETRSGRQGFGLKGIAERTQMLGGTLAMQSQPDSGTKILVTIELQGSAQ
jgi:signal transduction histidine kinase